MRSSLTEAQRELRRKYNYQRERVNRRIRSYEKRGFTIRGKNKMLGPRPKKITLASLNKMLKITSKEIRSKARIKSVYSNKYIGYEEAMKERKDVQVTYCQTVIDNFCRSVYNVASRARTLEGRRKTMENAEFIEQYFKKYYNNKSKVCVIAKRLEMAVANGWGFNLIELYQKDTVVAGLRFFETAYQMPKSVMEAMEKMVNAFMSEPEEAGVEYEQ